METIFSSIDYKDPVWIAIAFLFGALGRGLGLPPLVGFLVAGFVLNFLGVAGGHFLNEMADLGIVLLLFTIGLKLRVSDLVKIEIWGTALSHMLIFTLFAFAVLFAATQSGLPLVGQLSLLNTVIISFALSFSSTVFVVKTLDERGDFLSHYGQIAVGILIVQDIVAVIFLGVSAAKVPSIWAFVMLVILFASRPLIIRLSTKLGHGELLLLFGLVMALGGSALFEAVDMKADLGALVFGILLANTPKADELSKALFSVKELFLVGFFLSIGMSGLPTITIFIVALLLLVLIVVKSSLFFWLLSKLKLRNYPAIKAALLLGNYSEFGLIVTIVSVSQGWLPNDWLVVMAVLTALSFIVSAAINQLSDGLYFRYQPLLLKYQHPSLLAEKTAINLSGVDIIIGGMGRVGSGAYDQLIENSTVVGFDFDKQVVKSQVSVGRKTIYANISGSDFWSKIDLSNSNVEWILLCASNLDSNKSAATFARKFGFTGNISATSHYPDEEQALIESGVDTVFNIYAEAGAGLALHGHKKIMANLKK